MTSIAHIIPASPFLKLTVDLFEVAAPTANRFIAFGAQSKLDAYGDVASAIVERVVPGAELQDRVAAVVADADIVIAHSMNAVAALAFAHSRKDSLRVWSGWGGDYYGSSFGSHAGQLGPDTGHLVRQSTSLPGKAVRLRARFSSSRVFHRAAASADVFSSPIPEDLEVFRRRFRQFAGRYAQLNYATVEDSFSVGPERSEGADIMVGNSATPSNNHLEVFKVLAGADLGDRRVLVPLSYGDSAYADSVVEHGRQILGDSFVPMKDFIPFTEYLQTISGCSVSVMGHRRQQALGNIGSTLWRGADLVLDRRSPVASFLRSRGGEFSHLDEIDAGWFRRRGLAGEVTMVKNRRILQEFWGRDRALSNIRELVALR